MVRINYRTSCPILVFVYNFSFFCINLIWDKKCDNATIDRSVNVFLILWFLLVFFLFGFDILVLTYWISSCFHALAHLVSLIMLLIAAVGHVATLSFLLLWKIVGDWISQRPDTQLFKAFFGWLLSLLLLLF